MEDTLLKISLSDLRAVMVSLMSDERIEKLTNRPQLSFKEACELYDEVRIRKYIKSGLLKPISQNGKGSKVYYSHKRIIELTQNNYHHLKSLKL